MVCKTSTDGRSSRINKDRKELRFHRHADGCFIHCECSCRQGDGEVVITGCVKGVNAEDFFHTHPWATPEQERESVPSLPANNHQRFANHPPGCHCPSSGGTFAELLGSVDFLILGRCGGIPPLEMGGGKDMNLALPRKRHSSPMKRSLNSAGGTRGALGDCHDPSILMTNGAFFSDLEICISSIYPGGLIGVAL